MKYFIVAFSLVTTYILSAQTNFPENPTDAEFVTSDISAFWKAFDNLDKGSNPFADYLNNGTIGLKGFIENRIESLKNLLKTVRKRKEDYLEIRENSYRVSSLQKQTESYFSELEKWYPKAIFPPTYFVIGAYNSGGTISDSGLIIGVEMQNEIANIPFIVAHEIIHFNQNYPRKRTSLLEQSIKEGSADFIGELISGRHINERAFKFGNENEETLCQEFVEIMDGFKYQGWLYGSNGKKKERPNDLGYWMGYEICKAYFENSSDKKKAIDDILNIQDFKLFLESSGYLSAYHSSK